MNLAYDVTREPSFNRDWELRDQMRGAAISAMANIAEGFDSGSSKEFMRFLRISRRSSSELQSHSYAALDRKMANVEQFNALYNLAREVKSLIGGMIRYLREAPSRTSP